MQIETYECEETAEETAEMCDEAREIIEKMDLQGQRELLCPKDKDGTQQRIPYREMTAEERWVYETVCPHSKAIYQYSASPIPLRVLQVAAHAESLGVFDAIVVWAANPQEDPDPVLVARVGGEYDSGKKWFILARWGEALDEWPAMLNKAIARGRDTLRAKLNQYAQKIRAKLDAIDDMGAAELRTKQPSYYD